MERIHALGSAQILEGRAVCVLECAAPHDNLASVPEVGQGCYTCPFVTQQVEGEGVAAYPSGQQQWDQQRRVAGGSGRGIEVTLPPSCPETRRGGVRG